MISFSLKWRPYEVISFYICVYLHLPVFLPKNLGNKIVLVMFWSHPSLSPLGIKTLPHSPPPTASPPPPTAPPRPPPPTPLKGFSQVCQKGGFAKDLEGLEFLSGSRRCPGEKQQQHREEQLTGKPRHLCLTAPGHPFLLPSAHSTHPPPASCELGVRSRVALYHRNGSTISSVRSNLSPLA